MDESIEYKNSLNCGTMDNSQNMNEIEFWLNGMSELEMNSLGTAENNTKGAENDIVVLDTEISEESLTTEKPESKYFCKPCKKYFDDFMTWYNHHNKVHSISRNNDKSDDPKDIDDEENLNKHKDIDEQVDFNVFPENVKDTNLTTENNVFLENIKDTNLTTENNVFSENAKDTNLTTKNVNDTILTTENNVFLENVKDTNLITENNVFSENVKDTNLTTENNFIENNSVPDNIGVSDHEILSIEDLSEEMILFKNKKEDSQVKMINFTAHLHQPSEDSVPFPKELLQSKSNIPGFFQCPLCERVFSTQKSKTIHVRTFHYIFKRFQFYNKCLECNQIFVEREEFRNHLHSFHQLDMTPVVLRFSKIEDFFNWKSNMERETLTTYHQKTATNIFKYYCSRSGTKYPQKRPRKSNVTLHRMSRLRDSIKLGMACTSEIKVEKIGQAIIVNFFPVHYGHGTEMTVARLSPEEQAAVDEVSSKGVPVEKILKDLKGGESIDVYQMYPVKKRYLKWVKWAYSTEEYNTEICDTDCVTQWVKKCCEMEECPILYCQQENIGYEDEKFILIIMTEFQKHILMSATKQLICIDVIHRVSGAQIVVMLIMDELNTAFPVAYCIANKINKGVLSQFFTSIKESTGNLTHKYFMSNRTAYIYEAWVEVMGCHPQWLWSRWDTNHAIIAHLHLHLRKKESKRCKIFNVIQKILDCRNVDIFTCMFRNFINNLQSNDDLEKFSKWAKKNLDKDHEKWASCYWKEIDIQTSLHLEMMHNAFFACGTMGKKKRLYTFISVLMKVLRHKMLDRILNSFDEVKVSLAVNAINLCHEKSMNIELKQISSISNKLWKIHFEDSDAVFVARETEKCPDHCNLKCNECNICVHQYSCSCVHSMINANLCMHIHAVIFKFLGPHKPASPFSILKDISKNDSDNILGSPQLSSDAEISNDNCSPGNKNLIYTRTNNRTFRKRTSTKCKNQTVTKHRDNHLTEGKYNTITETKQHTLTESKDHSSAEDNSIDAETKPKPQVVISTPRQPYFPTYIPSNLKADSSTSVALSPAFPNVNKVHKHVNEVEAALTKAMQLFERIQMCKLNSESVAAITKHLNICLSITSTNKIERAAGAPSNIPINAVYVIKPQKKRLELVSSSRQSCKRIAPNLLQNSKVKLQKVNEKVTYSPHVLVVSSKESNSEIN